MKSRLSRIASYTIAQFLIPANIAILIFVVKVKRKFSKFNKKPLI